MLRCISIRYRAYAMILRVRNIDLSDFDRNDMDLNLHRSFDPRCNDSLEFFQAGLIHKAWRGNQINLHSQVTIAP